MKLSLDDWMTTRLDFFLAIDTGCFVGVRMISVVRCYTKLPWMIWIPWSWALDFCTGLKFPHSSPSADEVGDAEDRKLFHT